MRTRKPTPPPSGRWRQGSPRARSALLLLALACTACDGGMEGVYSNRSGSGSLAFRRNGTVDVTVFGGTYPGTYEVDGERVVVRGPNGTQVYTHVEGQLGGAFGTTFVREPGVERERRSRPGPP